MGLGRLWAGWRMPYVDGSAAAPRAAPGAGGPAGTEGERDDADARLGAGRAQEEQGRASAEGCVFCGILASGEPDETTTVLWRGRWTVSLLNAYPYASGHVLVLPRRHVARLADLTGEESAELWEGLRSAVGALEAAYGPDGVNVGANLGAAAGAGVPGHLHLHALPRWVGDTSFMTTVAEARVLPEALSASWARLRAAWTAAPVPPGAPPAGRSGL